MISVVIPTYKEPDYLDLCLKSAITGQLHKNEIIVVVDGFYNINKEVLEKYKDHIKVLILSENVGMIRAMNLGHYNASNDLVFHVQDDNVFPTHWDLYLKSAYKPDSIVTPNQIEPRPSMFGQFIYKNLGYIPQEFILEDFDNFQKSLPYKENDNNGWTFPFLINKRDYLSIGGFDESYPGPWVVDWEFFLKCALTGLYAIRTYDCHFYHFASVSTSSPEKQRIEQECHIYAQYKWGTSIKHNPVDNSKYL